MSDQAHQRGVTGPGNTAVFNYTDPATGAETNVVRVSGPGLPAAEYQVWFELQRLGVPAEAVRAVHTDLMPSVLPGGYTHLFLKRTFPNAELSCTHDYGSTAEERAKDVAALRQHAELMASIAGQQPPPAPYRVPVPQDVPPARPLPDHELGRQLASFFGPDGVLRHTPESVNAQPLLPESTKATLTQAGLPVSIPFFFAADGPAGPPVGGLFVDAATHLRATGAQPGEAAAQALANHVRIGSDGIYVVTVLCRGPEHSVGTVWAANPETGAGYYVNASVAAFVRSLALLKIARGHMEGMDPVAAGGVLTGMQRQLAGIDATALDDEKTWWSLMVEQMWHGLF